MNLDWYHCKGGVWCQLNKLDIEHKYLSNLNGVYIIWSGGEGKKVLIVGKGKIQEELRRLKNDIAIQAFAHLGLFVTWAEVDTKLDEIHYYLHAHLTPRMPTRIAAKKQAKVNLPWK